jgi:hypothetical protein
MLNAPRRREASTRRRCRDATQSLAFCQIGAGGTGRAPSDEAEAHVAGVKETDPGTIVTEMRVNAVRIQQYMADQSEHGGPRRAVGRQPTASQLGKSWTSAEPPA